MTAWNPDKVRVDVSRDLREIVRLWGQLGDEAEHRAVGRDAADIDAINFAGPSANLEAWEHKYEAAEAAVEGGFDRRSSRKGGPDYAPDQVAELHPLLVLATWEDLVREERDQPTDLRATVHRAADYLRSALDWMLGTNEDGDLNFLGIDALATELRACRSALENLLTDGERADRARVRCVNEDCEDKPRLVKVYADAAADDHHRCPCCRARYDYDEYVRAAKLHAANEVADDAWVTIADAAHSIERPADTVRSWIKAWKVSTQKAPGKPSTIYVFWPDVRDANREARVVESRRKDRQMA